MTSVDAQRRVVGLIFLFADFFFWDRPPPLEPAPSEEFQRATPLSSDAFFLRAMNNLLYRGQRPDL
jgi:hypothetical protein